MSVLDLPRALIDFETRSELDVRDVGAACYAEHPTTEILVMSYRLPDGSKGRWIPGQPFPAQLSAHIEAGRPLEAHNAAFERAVWKNKLHIPLGIPMPTKWIDTQATCAYRSLPLSLDEVGEVLDLHEKKDKRGKYLLQRLSKPVKMTKADKKAWLLANPLAEIDGVAPPTHKWNDDPDLLRELYEYCDQDVETEYGLGEVIGDLPLPEYRLWVLDQIVNNRGVKLDIPAVIKAKEIATALEERLTTELFAVTGGAVETANQRDRIIAFLESHGVYLPDLTSDTVDLHLNPKSRDEIPPAARRVLEIRQALAKASTKKLDKMLECVCADGRARGLLQYHGAGTGRWAGRLIQPQNFPRGAFEKFDMDLLVQSIMAGDPDVLDLVWGRKGVTTMDILSTALRGMFMADTGKVLMVSDFSAIEAVVLAWLAGEAWKVQAFERREPIYEKTAEMIFGYPVNKKDNPEERQVGKVCELAFGYQGGVGAWRNFDSSDKYTDAQVDSYKVQWREKHPHVVELWYGLQDAAITAVANPGKVASYRTIKFQTVTDKAGHWLTCILPNGRRLWYYSPRLDNVASPWGTRKQVSYEGRDSKLGGRWNRIRTYGGMLTENVVQAIARDLMAEAMIRVERKGYPIILTVHDEIVAEPPVGHGSIKEFEELMRAVPPWAAGCPVNVEGWAGSRYRK